MKIFKDAFRGILMNFKEVFTNLNSRLEWFGIHGNQVEGFGVHQI